MWSAVLGEWLTGLHVDPSKMHGEKTGLQSGADEAGAARSPSRSVQYAPVNQNHKEPIQAGNVAGCHLQDVVSALASV